MSQRGTPKDSTHTFAEKPNFLGLVDNQLFNKSLTPTDLRQHRTHKDLLKTERVGFEPTRVLPLHDFESCAFNRALPPLQTPHRRKETLKPDASAAISGSAKPDPLSGCRTKTKPFPRPSIEGRCFLNPLELLQRLMSRQHSPALRSHPQQHRHTPLRQQLQRQTITDQRLPHGQGETALMGSFQISGKGFPAGKSILGGWLQQHDPVQTPQPMDCGQLLRHPAASWISSHAEQYSSAVMTRQQPTALSLIRSSDAIAEQPSELEHQSRQKRQPG